MPRRDRETAQEEQESKEQQEVGTPQNKAKARNEDSSVAVVASTDDIVENNNNNNPLNKVVFIHHVLRFLKQDYVDDDDDEENVIFMPRFIQLRHVSSCWKETLEFYNPQPRETALTFLRHFSTVQEYGDLPAPSVLGSIVLCDIVGWLSHIEIANISVADSSGGREILWYLRDCLKSSKWKEEKSGFEHHAAFVRDTLLWITKYCFFDQNIFDWDEDIVEIWCNIVNSAITRKEGEYFVFNTPKVRDLLLSVSKTITTSNSDNRYEAVATWFDLVFTLAHDNAEAQNIFGTKEVCDEFIRLSEHEELKLFTYVYDRSDAQKEVKKYYYYYSSMFKSLSAITELKKNVNLFATVELRDTIVRIFKWIDIGLDEYWDGRESDSEDFLRLLHNLISTSETNKKLFAVESVRDVMFRECEQDEYFHEYSDTDYDNIFDFRHRRWTANITNNEAACLFFDNLVALVEVNPKLFLIDETRKHFVEFARRMVVQNFNFSWRETGRSFVSPAATRSFLTALQTMLHHNEKLFFSERIDDFLKKIKTEKKLLRGSTKIFSEIEKKYAKMKKHFSKEEQEKKDENAEEHRGQYWCDECESYHIDDDYVEELEDLEYDYWKKEDDDFVYSNCYWREREEEKRTREEEEENRRNRY